MNHTRRLFLVSVALAMGAFVCFVVYKGLHTRTHANNESGVEVAVAANDIQVDAKPGDREVRLVRIPKSVAPPDALHSTSEIIGRHVILPILKGEFILPSKLEAETGFGPVIPARMCAVSVRVDEITSVAGFVVPGSRVDVLLTRNSSMTNEPLTTIVLKDVAVIAVGSMIEWNAAGEPQSPAVMTLLVLPEDEQKLRLASSQGHIQLLLRPKGERLPRDQWMQSHLRKAIHRPNN